MSMSKTPTPAIDNIVKQITDDAYRHIEAGTADKRRIAIAIEANQRYIEYLDFLQRQDLSVNKSVVVEVDGTRIKFSSDDDFSDWLGESL